MRRTILFYLLSVTSIALAFNYLLQQNNEQLWSVHMSPNQSWALFLYKEPQPLHHAPNIVLYQQQQGSTQRQYIHHIELSEDDNVVLQQQIHWLSPNKAQLQIHCESCMYDTRSYLIQLGDQPSIHKTPILDRIEILKDRGIKADLEQ